MKTEFRIHNTTVRLIQGDILALKVDAVVNPANTELRHGGGLAGQIVRRGGDVIQRESDRLAPIATGDAVITTGGSLAAKFVIHTAGPIQGEGREDEKIYRSFRNVLALAARERLASIALPAVSTGIFGYPAERCAAGMKKAIRDHLESGETSLAEIFVCLRDDNTYALFLEEFNGG